MEPNGLVCRHPKKDGRKRVGGKGVGRERREVVRTKQRKLDDKAR
jgi:hypothetical protein